jgi:Rieske Fe-S protein
MLQKQSKSGLSRREMLNSALRGAAGAGAALLMPTLTSETEAASTPPVWTPIGPATHFTLNVPVQVALPAGSVLWVTRTGPKALEVVSARCTHHGCEIGWSATDKEFECPCHGAAFLPNGQNVHGTRHHPDEKLPALTTVPVRIRGGQAQVNLAAVPAGSTVPGRQD